MIYIDTKKLTIDGVDVYPDHESPTQFWYIPGAVHLAQRQGRKALSYLWYTDSAADSDGTGFLNFEVNTSVSAETLEKIKSEIASKWGVESKKISLATVPYHAGTVNFSVLGPIAAGAGDLGKDPAVLYKSAEQLVWNAGSSSLVGDNAAVCSVKFTREGKLAAAMKAALQNKGQHIAALYRLEFLSMRPSVTFTVKGTFEKTVRDFQTSIGFKMPLSDFILDLGIQAQWQRIMENTDLQIEVVNYSGDDPQKGLEWAQKLLLDYVLKNFFEVEIGESAKAWSPLSEAPHVEQAVQKAAAVESAAAEKLADKPKDKGKGDKSEGEGKDKESAAKDAEATARAVKEVVKAAMPALPQVNIRAKYYDAKQTNSIDFLYTEKKARPTVVLPQALVGLTEQDAPESYIVQVNRAQDPFGLPYSVQIATPDSAARAQVGLQALNIQARYPAGAPKSQQSSHNFSINADQINGANPLPFQYDAQGRAGVEYTADFVFRPTDDWQSDTFQYSLTGTTETGLITAMAESVAEFLTLNVELSQDFVWDDADQVVVTLCSGKWSGEKRLVFREGKADPQVLRIRSDARFKTEQIHYSVELRRGSQSLHRYGPLPLDNAQIVVVDRFADHIPVFFSAGFSTGTAEITLTYEHGDDAWEDQFTLEPGQKKVKRMIPTTSRFKLKSELEGRYTVCFDTGETLEGRIKGGATALIRAA